MSLLQAVTAYAFQRDMLNKLASNCARGVPGSAMFLSHGNTAQLEDSDSGYYTRNKNKLQSMIVGPTVLYITVRLIISYKCIYMYLYIVLVMIV